MESSYLENPILLVEDNPVDVDHTIRAFQRRKLNNPVNIARDGEEAIRFVKEWDKGIPLPVVILLDLKLPKYSGLEVLKEIKSHPVYKKIPVVILTTSSDESDMSEAYDLGANSYIVKPVDFEKFYEVATQIELYWTVINQSYFSKK